jgi:hypothetical protein
MRARVAYPIAFAALLAGASLYLAGRSGLAIHAAAERLGLPPSPWWPGAPAVLVQVLPDGAWAFALTLLVWRLWWPVRGARGRGFALVAPLLFAGGIELGQAVGLVAGVFDARDLVATVLAFGAAALGVVLASRAPAGARAPPPRAPPR